MGKEKYTPEQEEALKRLDVPEKKVPGKEDSRELSVEVGGASPAPEGLLGKKPMRSVMNLESKEKVENPAYHKMKKKVMELNKQFWNSKAEIWVFNRNLISIRGVNERAAYAGDNRLHSMEIKITDDGEYLLKTFPTRSPVPEGPHSYENAVDLVRDGFRYLEMTDFDFDIEDPKKR